MSEQTQWYIVRGVQVLWVAVAIVWFVFESRLSDSARDWLMVAALALTVLVVLLSLAWETTRSDAERAAGNANRWWRLAAVVTTVVLMQTVGRWLMEQSDNWLYRASLLAAVVALVLAGEKGVALARQRHAS